MAKGKRKTAQRTRGLIALVLVLLFGLAVYLILRMDAPEQQAPVAAEGTPVHTALPEDTSPAATPTPAAETPELNKAPLTVTVLDVGQADCMLLQSPNGKTMLIDAGDSESFWHMEDVFKAAGIDRLDVVVSTHPHTDHIGSMREVIQNYEIGTFYMTDQTSTTSTYKNMVKALQTQGVTVKQAAADLEPVIDWDADVEVRILSPITAYFYDDLNDSSVVLRVKYGDTAMLVTGDAGAYAENIMLAEWPKRYLQADVLKLGHHGSYTSTGKHFLAAVDPTVAVASLGKNNDYGYPHRETVSILAQSGITMYRTDEDGDVTFTLNGKQVSIATEK
ncbi:MAG: ComEC/Rec2 family competence protein [Eubacteriales bacterium]|nr:ComEC/Rec2 family competence protein [Eubacteriales bacterium]